MDVHLPVWLAWAVWSGFLGAMLFGLTGICLWFDARYERKQWPRMHQHVWVAGPPEDNGIVIEECSCMSFRIVDGGSDD
jgi:hypothetical protein